MLQSTKLLVMKNNLLLTTLALYSATFALGLFMAFGTPADTSAQVTIKAQTTATTATPMVSALR